MVIIQTPRSGNSRTDQTVYNLLGPRLDYASNSFAIMAFTVAIKHGGKAYDVQLDPTQSPRIFKENIYAVTGIPVDRMKVMIKGGMLKYNRHTLQVLKLLQF